MGLFTKPEVIILKESSEVTDYVKKLENLLLTAPEELKEDIQKEIAIAKAGIAGEQNILFELKNSGMDMVVLHDIYIETEDGLGAQIDFFVITPKLFYIIECKNLFGNIEIDNRGNFIRTITYNRKSFKEGIYSPITQNERHMQIFKEVRAEDKNVLLGALLRNNFDNYFRSLIVLANPKTVINDRYAKKEVKEKVIRADQLIATIKKMNDEAKVVSSSKRDILEIGQKYLEKDKKERRDYFDKYKELVDQINATSEADATNDEVEANDEIETNSQELVCPRCGSELVLRTAKKGDNAGNQFYGCSSFPKCRFIMKDK